MISVLILVSIYLVFYDMKYQRVPNLVNLLLFLSVIIYKLITTSDLITSLISGFIAFITFLFVYFVSGKKLGMGDCKYTAIIAIFFGYLFWLQSIVYCSILALLISGILIIFKKINRNTKLPFMPFLVSGWLLNFYFIFHPTYKFLNLSGLYG